MGANRRNAANRLVRRINSTHILGRDAHLRFASNEPADICLPRARITLAPNTHLEALAQERPRCFPKADLVLMTLITIHAVINVPSYARVSCIGRCFRVAIRTLENCIVVRIRMADRAYSVGGVASMVHREPRVVKRCPRPRRCVVAGGACGRENGRRGRMHWIRSGSVIGFVATVTISR